MSAITWIPAALALQNDLPSWKTLCQELSDKMVACGLIQTSDTGQLNISGVSAVGDDGTFAGFRIYSFDDSLQATAPIFIRVDFGWGMEGMYTYPRSLRSKTPRIKMTVGTGTNGAGTLTGLISTSYDSPQNVNPLTTPTATNNNAVYGTSYICFNATYGFFGVVHGANSRNNPVVDTTHGCAPGATAAILIQRSHNSSGVPTGDGVHIVGPKRVTINLYNDLTVDADPAIAQYINYGASTVTTENRNLALRQGDVSSSIVSGNIQTQRAWSLTPTLKPWNCIVTYRPTDISDGTEFSLETIAGTPLNFIALGVKNSMIADSISKSDGAYAMLFQ